MKSIHVSFYHDDKKYNRIIVKGLSLSEVDENAMSDVESDKLIISKLRSQYSEFKKGDISYIRVV